MNLVVNVCKDKLHYLEFVKPVEDLIDCRVIHYKDMIDEDLESADRVIICGTSLKDNGYLEDINKFEWIKYYKKPILGICAGMQIVSLVFGGKLKSKKEIGYYFENFKSFLGLKEKQEVFHLHNNYVTLPKGFTEYTHSGIPQAIKHVKKDIYGVLFNPEVRNKDVIKEFAKENLQNYRTSANIFILLK
jgi:GMP synthase-like glutamine amidotransferase